MAVYFRNLKVIGFKQNELLSFLLLLHFVMGDFGSISCILLHFIKLKGSGLNGKKLNELL